METILIKVDAIKPQKNLIKKAAALILKGEVVAFPTETVYGLGAMGMDANCTSKIYEAKGRPSDNPLILHISDLQQIHTLANGIPLEALLLADAFWPGPLTLVLVKKAQVPNSTTGGLDTVAIRMPDHPVALALIEAVGEPLAAPSANTSGRPSPTDASHVMHDLEGKIAAILDGGSTSVGIESTVVDFAHGFPTILRKGGITKKQLQSVLPNIEDAAVDHAHHSPGTRYKHYSPSARLTILPLDETPLLNLLRKEINAGNKIGWIGPGCPDPDNMIWKYLPNEAEAYAKAFFGLLRELDDLKVDHIVVEPIEEEGLGEAVMDRMRKAAGV
ncbi:MAG: L-threonylcarbamoyladenylate synthase [Flavobacteriales bacterium]|jgi:L-threonylcarbamoyladenylate synthase